MTSRKAKSLPVVLLGVCLPLALGAFALTSNSADPAKGKDNAKPAEIVPLHAKTEPAENPTRLSLQVDDRQVVGWISGTKDFAGQQVTVQCNDKTEKVTVEKGNTFSWKYQTGKTTTANFRVGELRGAVLLSPPVSENQPSVFFVVDRTAYRPAQALHFAGFLRRLDGKGEFEPIANTAVEVHLTSERKNTVAAKLKLTSDDFGRITGSYTFSDADALDNYIVAIPNYKGTARVLLGEYRKSKVKLKIGGQVADGKLKVKFEALDFLDKPVPGSKISFTAQVVQKDRGDKKHALKAEDFVYHRVQAPADFEIENLPEDQLLLYEAHGVSILNFLSGTSTVVAQVNGDIDMQGKEAGEYAIPIKTDWLKGNCSVVVQGVVIDTNGREQRATQTIPLNGKANGVQLALGKRYFTVDEKIEVKAALTDEAGKPMDASTTLVAMRLANNPAGGQVVDWEDQLIWNGYQANRLDRLARSAKSARGRPVYRWQPVNVADAVSRTMTTAVAFKSGSATVKLSEPGAYKLVAIAQLSDGSTIQNEIGCVVRTVEDTPALILQLDKADLAAGERLTGALHSRFANARVLLTLRDSSGIRLTRPLQMQGAMLKLDEPLPANLRYGCSVDVQYLDKEDQTHATGKFVRVTPTDQMLTIKTNTKDVYGPGEQVKLDIQVNRNEPVDLVVSVYDQSLLGIAADKSIDIRNFYLADERARTDMAREMVRRKVGAQTVKDLVKRAKDLLAKDKELVNTAEGQELQQFISLIESNRYLDGPRAATLLRLAGVDVRLNTAYYNWFGHNWRHHNVGDDILNLHLWELLQKEVNGFRLAYDLHQDTIILRESHPNYAHPSHAYRYWGRNRYWGNAWNGNQMLYNQFDQLQYLGRARARGDAHFSQIASGNAMHSVEGQAFVSHLPAAGPAVEMLSTDGDQSHIYLRRDFSDSAFWKANVRTDETGKASVEFKLPDSLTNWQVVVTAVSRKMHVGQAKSSFRTFKPIMIWPMIPRVFTEDDKVVLFGSVHNRSDERQTIRVKLKTENGTVLTTPETTVVVEPKSNVPVYWVFKPGKAGFTQLLMTADCPAGSDASLKRLPVVRNAAEQVVTASGFCKDGTSFRVPEGVDLQGANLEVTFAPSLAADMADTLNYLVEYPYGCVEQTMSRFLPAIKVAQVLQKFHVNHPELEKKLPGCVAGGIKRLLELQQPDGGWGWHGNGGTHEMMTPYALYGLLQAEKAGYSIPAENAVQRGLDRLNLFIQQMGEPQTGDRIYCMYVYAHRRDLQPEWWQFVEAQLKKKKLSDYSLALALEMAVQKDKKELAEKLATALRDRAQKGFGGTYWQTSDFSRWGIDRFEITAAVMKALVAFDKDDPLIDGILGFFAANKRGNRWNSTKDTAMILFAMCDYLAKMNVDPKGEKALTFAVNGGEASKVVFDDGLAKKVVVPGSLLKAGANKLAFKAQTTGIMYRLVFRYWQSGKDVKPMDKGIEVTRRFYLLDGKGGRKEIKSGASVPRGSYIESEVTARTASVDFMRYVLVENPKPSCGEVLPVEDTRFNQNSTPHVLREERTAAVCYHHEQTGNVIEDRCVLLAELAGEYTVPPAHVEMMYATENRGHSGTFLLKVTDDRPAK